ncbi:hypothetical protein MRBLBA71_003822 [Bacillus nitratireducens]|uniref:hypothetical protein n=1 Tax=Bacillus nitratireducens TaxID=2026193 RepID=UPI00346569EF
MTIVGEVVVVWAATGLSVITMKVEEKIMQSVPYWLPCITMYITLTGSFSYLLSYVLFAFL